MDPHSKAKPSLKEMEVEKVTTHCSFCKSDIYLPYPLTCSKCKKIACLSCLTNDDCVCNDCLTKFAVANSKTNFKLLESTQKFAICPACDIYVEVNDDGFCDECIHQTALYHSKDQFIEEPTKKSKTVTFENVQPLNIQNSNHPTVEKEIAVPIELGTPALKNSPSDDEGFMREEIRTLVSYFYPDLKTDGKCKECGKEANRRVVVQMTTPDPYFICFSCVKCSLCEKTDKGNHWSWRADEEFICGNCIYSIATSNNPNYLKDNDDLNKLFRNATKQSYLLLLSNVREKLRRKPYSTSRNNRTTKSLETDQTEGSTFKQNKFRIFNQTIGRNGRISNSPYVAEEVYARFADFMVFKDWQLNECIFTGSDRGHECSNISHQLPDVMEYKSQLPAVTVTVKGTIYFTPDEYDAKRYTTTSLERRITREGLYDTGYLDNICYYHAETDLDGAIAEIYKKYSLAICCAKDIPPGWISPRIMVLNFFFHNPKKVDAITANAKVSFPEMREVKQSPLQVITEKKEEIQEPKKEVKPLVKNLTKRVHERFVAPVVFPSNYDAGSISYYNDEFKGVEYDRRCICEIVRWDLDSYRCKQNTGMSNSSFDNENKSQPAYILVNKNGDMKSPKNILGCICYTHAKYLQQCFRYAADLHNISMNDIRAYMLWDSDKVPEYPSEKRYAKMYKPNPEWKKEDGVVKKWISREGNVGTCKYCKVEFSFAYHCNSGNYVCDECDAKVYSLGCNKCKVPFTHDNVHLNFPIENEDGYFCRECYKCLQCNKKLKDFYEETSKGIDYKQFSDDIRASRVGDLRICGACNKLKNDNNGYGQKSQSDWEHENGCSIQ